jgi:hypothetical protein
MGGGGWKHLRRIFNRFRKSLMGVGPERGQEVKHTPNLLGVETDAPDNWQYGG